MNLHHRILTATLAGTFCLLSLGFWVGCAGPGAGSAPAISSSDPILAILHQADPDRARALLAELGYLEISKTLENDGLMVSGSVEELERIFLVLDLIDNEHPFVVQFLCSRAQSSKLPKNAHIATSLGGIAIGTFADPPSALSRNRAIIDIHNDRVVAIIPAAIRSRLLTMCQAYIRANTLIAFTEGPTQNPSDDVPSPTQNSYTANEEVNSLTFQADQRHSESVQAQGNRADSVQTTPLEPVDTTTRAAGASASQANSPSPPKSVIISLEPIRDESPVDINQSLTPIEFPNGNDEIELSLPETVQLVELLDLAAEYLDMAYVYDPNDLNNQIVVLKLQGRFQGKMRVKDLYTVLQTVLMSKGFAMIQGSDELIRIVPIDKALGADPQLLDRNGTDLRKGDLVVTKAFELNHVDVASVIRVLKDMKLGVSFTTIQDARMVFVTCFTHRLKRIEALIQVMDKPGRAREFHLRRLTYTRAVPVVEHLKTLVEELLAPPPSPDADGSRTPDRRPTTRIPNRIQNQPSRASTDDQGSPPGIYLAADERINGILMVGQQHHLSMVEELVDAIDSPPHDLRRLETYEFQFIPASAAFEKIKELHVLDLPLRGDQAGPSPGRARPANNQNEDTSVLEAHITVLESTNQLLINATDLQHARLRQSFRHIDVSPLDLRGLQLYPINHVRAADVLEKLQELNVLDEPRETTAANPSATGSVKRTGSTTGPIYPSDVAVLELANSLLVQATVAQHVQIQQVIQMMDIETPKGAIPFEIYFLENQSPEHMAKVLTTIVKETMTRPEGDKIEAALTKLEDRIIVVPDEQTFSLIVYAIKRNQDWIGTLIEQLDRRRPQVLIDVTLVEISKNDEFNFDLNVISGIPNLDPTSGLLDPLAASVTAGSVIGGLSSAGRTEFLEFQSNSGSGMGFYGDRDIMLLVKAMESKKYGRVLAQPKILVNDNEVGTITTKDTTYVQTRTQAVLAGNTEAVTTAIDFLPYDAGITLEIHPHISEGNLLRLEISMSRSDFTAIPSKDQPPDTSTSDITTVVTVPDGSTIILGGMDKINQTKGVTKVPLLGDLPLIGALFRGVADSDVQRRLYIFVKAEIIRPADVLSGGDSDLDRISRRDRAAFERHEKEFQEQRSWPGIQSKTTSPERVLDDY